MYIYSKPAVMIGTWRMRARLVAYTQAQNTNTLAKKKNTHKTTRNKHANPNRTTTDQHGATFRSRRLQLTKRQQQQLQLMESACLVPHA